MSALAKFVSGAENSSLYTPHGAYSFPILRNINEVDFKPLYSDKVSRPNAPVNILVSTLILKELKGISYDELMESVMFDLRFKAALA